MRINCLTIFFSLLLCGTAFGQIIPEKVAQSRIEKQKWAKAEHSIKKSLRKDSVNVEGHFLYSQWYFEAANPDFNIDSAYQYALLALADFKYYDERQRDRLSRFPIDSSRVVHMIAKVDSAAFARAKNVNSENSYNDFLNRFEYSKYRPNAVELRDEVSFLDALKINTYQSFDEYLSKYPDSHRASEAKSRYEKLLYEDRTKDGKLKSFKSFFQKYPRSPYANQALKQIFEIGTASGKLSDLTEFVSTYGNESIFSTRTRDLAYHISRESAGQFPVGMMNDSIRNVKSLEIGFWVPFLKNDRYGFMDEDGKERIIARLVDIPSQYLCGDVNDDIMITSAGLVSRSGSIIFKGDVKQVEDIGLGYVLAEGACNRVVHKSGTAFFSECIEDAKIIADHFLAVKADGKWNLFALNGRLLTESYDDIQSIDAVIVLERNRKKSLHSIDEIAGLADKNPLPRTIVFDEVRKLSTDKILVRNGSLEGVVNSKLEFIIPLDRQALTLTSFGFTKKVLNKVTTVGVSQAIDNEEFVDIRPYLRWLGLYKTQEARLYDTSSMKMVDEHLDSLWFSNRLAFGAKGDSVRVWFGSGRRMSYPSNGKMIFVKSPDSVRFFLIEGKNKKALFEVESGMKRFTMEFDKLEELTTNIFLIEWKGKKGLVGLEGKLLVPIEYDAIVKTSENFVSLLKDKKFGIYDLERRSLIKPAFERNINFYNKSTLVAFKDGGYGFVDLNAQPISDFEFEEVNYWSDSLALVKRNFRWMIYGIKDKEIYMDQIKDYHLIKDTDEEKIALIHKGNEYGVISNRRGEIIPPTFSDILNLGTDEKQLYFTEKHVEEAEIFVVIYYNSDGVFIRREIYEADDYDKIYCR
ncbi:MAG: WG repeat-containing protein [Cyclobacteriaceae bacterium]